MNCIPKFTLAFILLLFSVGANAAPLRVALILDKGGKDDKSFNAAAYAGAKKAQSELKLILKEVEITDDAAVESTMRSFAAKDFDLIIGIGYAQADALKKIAEQYPTKHFAIVDADVRAPNVQSLLFEEHQGSYLVGALAAMASKTGKIGFIGGVDAPLIRRFQLGFAAGVKKINPKAQVLVNYVGVTSEAWNNPAKAKELGLMQYGSGVDVIFAAAGASNSGLFDAAEEKKALAIGVDSNQNWVKPGFILTSMLKRVDEAVYQTIRDFEKSKFTAGPMHYGLKNHGIDYALDQYNDKLVSAEMRRRMEALRVDIMADKIQVPDYYSIHGKK